MVATGHIRRPVPAPAVAADDICLLLYTSGTASAPKGVQHTHNTVLAEQRTMPALLAGKPDDVSLVTFPPGHIAGVGSMLRPLLSGARTVFMDGWDPAQAVEVVHRFGVTCTAGTPFHLAGILDLGDTGDKLASLREFLVGAAPVAEEIGRRAAQARISTFRSYGATEHPTITGEHEGQPQWARLSTDGKPLPGSEIRIVGSDGADCPIGIDGEVVVRGPDQFVGYQDYALNAEAFTDDGWFRTGDLGHLDAHGRLTITDRIKDVIIRGGETISSGQVEEVLNAHPAVADGVAVAAQIRVTATWSPRSWCSNPGMRSTSTTCGPTSRHPGWPGRRPRNVSPSSTSYRARRWAKCAKRNCAVTTSAPLGVSVTGPRSRCPQCRRTA